MSVATYDHIWEAVLLTVAVTAVSLLCFYSVRQIRAQVNINREQACQDTGRHTRLRALCDTQSAVIDAFITELAMRPKTYETMPEDLKNAFYAAHEGARMTMENEGKQH
jgi:hypothetical protein